MFSMAQDRTPVGVVFDRLLRAFGPQHWWPADSPFEVMVGAVLTQHTAWHNVEKAMVNLKATGDFSPRGVLRLSRSALEIHIQPAGIFRVKAQRLCALLGFLVDRFGGDIAQMATQPTETLRDDLLCIQGVGPETADCILLYALGKPIFVVDAYTRRIFGRLGLIDASIGYDALQAFLMRNLVCDVDLFNEYHALIVTLGKHHCKPKPRCGACPLLDMCAFGQSSGCDGC